MENLKYDLVAKVIRDIPLDNYTFFECNDRDFALVYEPRGNEPSPAWINWPSRQVNGADIILWDCVPEDFKRPMILHEVTEWFYGFCIEEGKKTIMDPREAHLLAKIWDKRFAEESLFGDRLMTYLGYREEFAK